MQCYGTGIRIRNKMSRIRNNAGKNFFEEIEYDFQKSRVTGPRDHMVSVSAKKLFKKMSCLFTLQQCTV